jgi:hypothetical protein
MNMKKFIWIVGLLMASSCGDDKGTAAPNSDSNNMLPSCSDLDPDECELAENCIYVSECLDAPTQAECSALDEEQCKATQYCAPKYGNALVEDRYCSVPTFFSCDRGDQGCTNSFVLMQRHDGVCAYFNNGCMPSVGTWTENGVPLDQCGIPDYMNIFPFSETCLDWEGEPGSKPMEPNLAFNTVDLGDVDAGSTATAPLHLVNLGTPITIVDIQIDGDDFSIESIELPLTLGHGESVYVDISLTATTGDLITTTVSVTTEDPDVVHSVHVSAN